MVPEPTGKHPGSKIRNANIVGGSCPRESDLRTGTVATRLVGAVGGVLSGCCVQALEHPIKINSAVNESTKRRRAGKTQATALCRSMGSPWSNF